MCEFPDHAVRPGPSAQVVVTEMIYVARARGGRGGPGTDNVMHCRLYPGEQIKSFWPASRSSFVLRWSAAPSCT